MLASVEFAFDTKNNTRLKDKNCFQKGLKNLSSFYRLLVTKSNMEDLPELHELT